MKLITTWILLAALTPLAAPASSPSEDLYAAIRANHRERLQLALRDNSVNAKDDHGVTPLMYAAAVGSLDAMKLLLDHHADPNAVNELGSTALMWCATDIAKVRLLLDHHADVRIVSKQGRTALQVAAMSDHSAEIVRLLIAKGADVKAIDQMQMTTLNAAALGNDTETVRILLDAGVDVNATGPLMSADAIIGESPLMNAVFNGNPATVKLLLAKGAKVDFESSRDHLFQVKKGSIRLGGFTPLAIGAAFGPPEIVKALLDAGASPNVRDVRGMTPLMLAVATDRQNPEIIRMLVAKGADVKAKSIAGETSLDWAHKFGNAATMETLQRAGAVERAIEADPLPEPSHSELKPALARSIKLLEASSTRFFQESGCVSCHSQNVTDLAVGLARARSISVDEHAAADRVEMARSMFAGFAPLLLERIDPPGGGDTTAYTLTALAASHYAPDRMTDAMAHNLAAAQRHDGSWHVGGWARPPIEDGDISRTALGIRALKVYGPPARSLEMNARIARARQWLSSAQCVTAEDRNMQLLGLLWAGEEPASLKQLSAAITASQRADGGWGQRTELPSDAYATGQSLYALAQAGCMTPAHAAYAKGVQYLLSTQRGDGSWYVRSRSPKFQPYFESGFPYGRDQWISASGTAWATMALILAAE